MDLFLDSSNPKEILEARSWGLLAGVTSNPGLISAAGPDMEKTLGAIVDASPGPVFAQVIGWHDPEPMIRQARWLHAFSDRIIVKLPASIAGLQALQTAQGRAARAAAGGDCDRLPGAGVPGRQGRRRRRRHLQRPTGSRPRTRRTT